MFRVRIIEPYYKIGCYRIEHFKTREMAEKFIHENQVNYIYRKSPYNYRCKLID